MRKILLFVWFLLPIAAAAYHFGPGQERLRTDHAADAISTAKELAHKARALAAKEGDEAAKGLWTQAEAAYSEALTELPADKVAESRELRLERAKAQMFISQLPEARHELETLVDELVKDPDADANMLVDARSSLANAQYYTTWLMRLEGAAREEWEPEIEAARQNYRWSAEQALAQNDTELASTGRENLESAIRLERMKLEDLQGLPLPSQ